MDPRLKNCLRFVESVQGRPLSRSEQDFFQQQFNEIRQIAIKEGKSLNAPVKLDDGRTVTYLEYKLGTYTYDTVSARKQAIAEMAEAATNGRALMDLETRIENTKNSIMTNERYEKKNFLFNRDPAKKKRQMQAKAVMANIVDNNDTWGTIPMDKLMRVTGTEFFGDFHGRLDTLFKNENIGISHETFIADRKNLPAFMDEYNNFLRKKGAHESPTTNNKGAYLVAKALWEEVTMKAKSRYNQVGRWMPYNQLGMRVKWNRNLVKKMSKDEFIKKVGQSFDPIHGDELRRNNLAADIYDAITSTNSDRANWRNIGDPDPDVSTKIAREEGHITSEGEVHGVPGKFLRFKDGEAFSKVTSEFADDATLHQQIISHITDLSRDISVTKFLGSKSHDQGMARFKDIIDANNITNDVGSIQKMQFDASMNYLETLVRPEIIEQMSGNVAFNTLRNIQAAAKLGSAVITAILDIPVFITTGSRIFNLPIFGRDGLLATVFPGSGMISGSKADRIRYAKYFIEMTESWQNAAGARFILNDGLNNQKGFTRGSAAFAHYVFRGSGLNWWTKSLQSSAAGVYGRHLGELIQTGRQWEDLGKPFQSNLGKYGITESEWNNLIKFQNDTTIFPNGILDANGRLDMYKLGSGNIVINPTGKAQMLDGSFQTNTRSKFIAAVADAVDTMVMKPSQFDKMAGAFFSKEYHGMGAQIVRSMTQFKAHPISFFRKTTMRTWKHNNTKDTVQTISAIAASLMLTSAVTVQLKEFLKGRPTFDASKPDFWARVVQEAGVLGIVSDMFFSFAGGEKLAAGMMGKTDVRGVTNMDVFNNIIGPLGADTIELMTSSINIGIGAATKDEKRRQREYEDLAILASNQIPFKSIWYTRMLWRKYVTEFLSEMINPRGYHKAQRNLKKRMRKSRSDGLYFGKPTRTPDGALMDFWKGGFQ